MANKKSVAKKIKAGYFAYVEIERLNEETQTKEKVFVKTGYLEQFASAAREAAQKKHPTARVIVQGIRNPAEPFVIYKPTKGQPDYTCFSSKRGG